MTDLNEVIRKARTQQFGNGTIELMLGVYMLISAMSLEMIDNLFISGIVAIMVILLASRFFEKLQIQISVPRSKPVNQPEKKSRFRLWLVIGFVLLIVSVSFLLMYARPDNALIWLTFLVGAIIGVYLLVEGIRLRVWRLAFHGMLSLVLGATLSPLLPGSNSLSGYSGMELVGIYFFVMGISLALAGWLTLSRIVKSQSPKREITDG